jgi:hypothetical protein
MSKKSQSAYVQRPMLAEVWVVFALSAEQMLCEVPMHVDTTFSPYSHKKCVLLQTFLALLETSDRYFLLVAVTGPRRSLGLTPPEAVSNPVLEIARDAHTKCQGKS